MTAIVTAAWPNSRMAFSKDPLDDLVDLTFGDGPDVVTHPGDHTYSHVDLLDSSDPFSADESPQRAAPVAATGAPAPSPLAVVPAARFGLDDSGDESFSAPSGGPLQPSEPASAAATSAAVAEPAAADPLSQRAGRSASLFDDEPLSSTPDASYYDSSSKAAHDFLPEPSAAHAGLAAPGGGGGGADASSSSSHVPYNPITKLDGGNDDGGGPSEIRPQLTLTGEVEGLSLPDTAVRLWVRDPERFEVTNKLGIKSTYFAYLVRTESSLPGLRADGVEVRRRFSDFEALHKVLKLLYKGYFIPPLPEKSFIEAKIANDDFLRLRRADLQAFLRGVAHHPALRESDVLQSFLLQSGELAASADWVNILQQAQAAVRAKAPGALGGNGSGLDISPVAASANAAASAAGNAAGQAVKAVFQMASWIKHSVGVVGPSRELTEEEQTLRKNKDLATDLERLLDLCCSSARSLCGHMNALCTDYHELSRNMGMLTRYEEAVQAKNGQYTEVGAAAAGRAEDLQRMAYASSKQDKLWKMLSLRTAASLVSLHDYMIMMPEVVSALEEREAALAHIWALEDELMAKQQALLAASGAKANNREKRTYVLNQAIASAEEQLDAAREEYRTIKGRNVAELSRLGLERGSDFRRMMGHFAATQAELLKASASMWAVTAGQYGVRPAQ